MTNVAPAQGPTTPSVEGESAVEFLVEFEVHVPPGTSEPEVRDREQAESVAAAKLADEGHLVRLWRRPQVGGGFGTRQRGRARS